MKREKQMQKEFERKVILPKEVQVEVNNNWVKMKLGEKEVGKKFLAQGIEIKQEENWIKVSSKNTKKKSIAVANAIVSQISNLSSGLQKEFEYKLEIVYSHFPMHVTVKEDVVEISNFGGAKMPKIAKIVGKNTKVAAKGKDIIVTSPNKEHAGQTAANLENATKMTAKDKRVFQDGIYIVSKPKAAVN